MDININEDSELLARVIRLETKLVRGFSELGVDVVENNWLQINKVKKNIYFNTLGRSFGIILKTMYRRGVTERGEYCMYHNGIYIGKIIYNPNDYT